MGETTYEMTAEIDRARGALDKDLAALEARVREETDIRVQARRHPEVVNGLLIGIVISSGLALGWIARKIAGA